MQTMWFRHLGADEERAFREDARKTYEPFSHINGLWHPCYQDECVKINLEHSVFTEEKKEDEE